MKKNAIELAGNYRKKERRKNRRKGSTIPNMQFQRINGIKT